MRRVNKQYCFVISQLVSRELKRKYSRSKLGILWSVLNPLLSMAVLSMIFSTIFQRSIENYPVYYLTGYLLWNLFTSSTNSAMTSLADNQVLLLQVKFPKMIFPLSRICTAFVNFLFSLSAYAVILAVFRIQPNVHMFLFPVITILLLAFSSGISFILSVGYIFFGDIRHLYGVLLTLWMYLSALFYPVEVLPQAVQAVIRANPIYSYIDGARACMLYGSYPSAIQWMQMVLWAAVAYIVGWIVFRYGQDHIIRKL